MGRGVFRNAFFPKAVQNVESLVTRLETKIDRLAEADAVNLAFPQHTQFPISVAGDYGVNSPNGSVR